MDPDQAGDNRILLTWQSSAPSFKSDWDVYIWQEYRTLPSKQFAHISIFFPNPTPNGTEPISTDGVAKVYIVFCSTAALELYSRFRNRSPAPGQEPVQARTPKGEILFSILGVFSAMRGESRDFVQGCFDQIQEMVSSKIKRC